MELSTPYWGNHDGALGMAFRMVLRSLRLLQQLIAIEQQVHRVRRSGEILQADDNDRLPLEAIRHQHRRRRAARPPKIGGMDIAIHEVEAVPAILHGALERAGGLRDFPDPNE